MLGVCTASIHSPFGSVLTFRCMCLYIVTSVGGLFALVRVVSECASVC